MRDRVVWARVSQGLWIRVQASLLLAVMIFAPGTLLIRSVARVRVREKVVGADVAAPYQRVGSMDQGVSDEELYESLWSLDDLGSSRHALKMRVGDGKEGPLEVQIRSIRVTCCGEPSFTLRELSEHALV